MTDPRSVEQLFERFARTGDPRALGAVYDALAPALLGVALHLARDAAEAEDLLQATFVTAIERASTWRADTRVEPWLVGILGNHARNAARSGARVPDERRLAPERAEAPDDAASANELEAALTSALAGLPEAFRPVLVLRLRHGLTSAEIAAALGRPPGTVRTQLARGLEAVRRLLPASLAGAFAALAARPARGLDAVRAALLEHASAAAPAALTTTTVLGVLTVKLALAAVVAVALVATSWFLLQSDDAASARPDPPVAAERPPAERALESDAARASEAAPRTAAASEAPSSSAPAVPSSSGTRLRVHVLHAATGESAARALVLVSRAFAGGYPLDDVELVTDERGDAELAGLAPGLVYARGVQGGSAHGRVPARGELALELVLPRGVDVEGRVTDASGRPVGGAHVWLSDVANLDSGRVVATTASDGAFRLRDVGERRWIAAKAAGFALSYLQEVRGAVGDVARPTIVLDRTGARLAGRVVDAAGLPLAGVFVLAGEEGALPTRVLETGLSTRATAPQGARTDERGEYAVDGVPLGTCVVQARAPGTAAARVETVITESGGRADLQLVRGARVAGRVMDAAGAPIATVEFRHGPPGRFASALTHSLDDGRFELAGLPPGDVLVTARTLDQRGLERTFRLAAGEEREWNLRFDDAGGPPMIRGVVVDELGAPLAGMGVSALAQGVADPDSATAPSTDARGAFALQVRPDRVYRVLVCRPDEWALLPRAFVDGARAGGEPLRLVVEDAQRTRGRVVGTVTDAAGAPVADADVLLWHPALALWHQEHPSGPEARFAFELVPPGDVTLEVRSAAHPWKKLGTRAVRAGETLELGAIVLDDAGRVGGTITVAGGAREELLKAVELTLSDDRGQWSGTASIAGGEYRSGALAPGTHRLHARGDGILDVQRDVEVAAGREARIDLVLVATGTRPAVCTVPGDAPAPEWLTFAALDAQRATVCLRSARVGADRSASVLLSVPPGAYRLVVLGPNGRGPELEFTQSGTGREGELRASFPAASDAAPGR
ncbi:MAG: sigma-70 family RNA polymerase sigma factor [Planctomycetes bacterium]|nr:sigma-70 family RNA polymerase sigma factor [Planctomycetota bacterium]